jgi:hypothetical protein
LMRFHKCFISNGYVFEQEGKMCCRIAMWPGLNLLPVLQVVDLHNQQKKFKPPTNNKETRHEKQ